MSRTRITGNIFSEHAAKVNAAKLIKMKALVVALAENTPVDTGRAQQGWEIDGSSIRNSVEYLPDLNHGSSKQAPEYFIEKTLLAQEGISPSGTIVRLE